MNVRWMNSLSEITYLFQITDYLLTFWPCVSWNLFNTVLGTLVFRGKKEIQIFDNSSYRNSTAVCVGNTSTQGFKYCQRILMIYFLHCWSSFELRNIFWETMSPKNGCLNINISNGNVNRQTKTESLECNVETEKSQH